MLGPGGYRGSRRGRGSRGNYRPRGNSRGSGGYKNSRQHGSYGGGSYVQGYQRHDNRNENHNRRGRGHRDNKQVSYRRGGYNYGSNNNYRKRNHDDRTGNENPRSHKRKYEPRVSKNFRSAEPQNISFKLKRLVLGSGDPSSHENDETDQRQHNGLFSSFHDMFLLTRVDSHQKTIQINAKQVEGTVFSTTIHPSAIYSINVFTDGLPDETFFEKFEEQLILESELAELRKEKDVKQQALDDLREKSKPGDADDEEGEKEEASAVAEKKLELEIKQKELDVLEVSEKMKKVEDRLEQVQAEIFEATQTDGDNEDNMEDEPTLEEEEAEPMEEEEEVESAAPKVDEESIKAMKVAELREYITEKGQTPKGNKAALIEMALSILKEESQPEQIEVDVTEGSNGDDEEMSVAEDVDDIAEGEEDVDDGADVIEEDEDPPAKAAESETIDLTAEEDGRSLCRVFIGLREPLTKVRTNLAGCKEVTDKTYCLLLEADLKEGMRFNKVKSFLEKFVNQAYNPAQVNLENWGNRKVTSIASQLLKESMQRRKLDFETGECPNGCGEIMRAYLLVNHERNECKNRLIACQYCNTELMHCKMAEHKSVCDLCLLRCPNNCGKTIARKDMADHLQNECSNQKVDCDFLAFGCKIKEKRKNKAQHNAKRCVAHLDLVRKAHSKLQRKYDKLTDFLEDKFGEEFPSLDEPEEEEEVTCIVIED